MDGEPFFSGFPFDTGDILRHPFQLAGGNHEIIEIPELQSPLVNRELKPDLYIPELGAVTGIEEQPLDPIESDAASYSTDENPLGAAEEDTVGDVWTLDLNLGAVTDGPRLSTWESFEKKDEVDSQRAPYLSEAGPAVFDAALVSAQAESSSNGVLPQDVMLRALCNLVLGRSSILFQWNVSKRIFEATLEDVPTSGLSIDCHRSLITRLMDCGLQYRTLSEYASHLASPKRSCTALVAFKGCVTKILDAIESHIGSRNAQIRSLLQLQALVERPHQLLAILSKFLDLIDGQSTDEAIISIVSDEVHQIVCCENAFSEVLQQVLSRISLPWLEHLCADLGLSHANMLAPLVQSEGTLEDVVEELDQSFGEHAPPTRELPGFVTNQDRSLVRETKKSLRLLRQHLPLSPTGPEPRSTIPLQVSQERLEQFLPTRSVRPDLTAFRVMGDVPAASDTNNNISESGGLAWAHESAQESYLASLATRMSEPVQSTTEDSLSLITTSAFDTNQSTPTDDSSHLATALPFNPLEPLRPLIQSHAAQVNKALLRHLFEHCKLRQHLDLQRQFHLIGNRDFVSRLTRALFSTDTQSAERKRGGVPTAEMMGLRIDARDEQKWPPASSEIQLTLMGILSETSRFGVVDSHRLNAKQLPGNLSFAIRELPEEEIEKVLDFGSIYALDFLKLQYTPPPPLEAILTPTTMQAYDDVFRFLLKMLRALHVTTKLREMYATQPPEQPAQANASERFSVEAHHVVTVLMSHFMDVGIEVTWQNFQTSIGKIETSLDQEDAVSAGDMIGLGGLRQLHETCVEGVRSRLFLRRKQQKLRNGVEDVLIAVLKCAASLEANTAAGFADELRTFRDSVTGLLSTLRAIIEKPAKDRAVNKASEDDVEAVRILLLRLTWNEFYGDARSR